VSARRAFLKEGVALWTGWKRIGQFASCLGERGQRIVKGNGLLDGASTLHDTTRPYRPVGNPNTRLSRGLFVSGHKVNI